MSSRVGEMHKNYSEGASENIVLQIPGLSLSTLISMVAIGKWVVCAGGHEHNPSLRRAVEQMEQLVYEQSYEKAGADEIWQDPQDGSYHHPTFPEQDGDAWDAMQGYEDEVTGMKLVETAAHILSIRSPLPSMTVTECHDHYQNLLQDIMEEEGMDGVISYLIS